MTKARATPTAQRVATGAPLLKPEGQVAIQQALRLIAKGGKGQYSPRDWLANLRKHPEFTFCLKESLEVELPAVAVEIVDPEDRRALMSAPETQWYRDQVDSIEDLVNGSPIVEVFFEV